MDLPLITPADGPGRGRVKGFPRNPRDWTEGILGEAGTWTYFRFTPHAGSRRVTIATGIRDVQRADATTRETWRDFPAPMTIYREPADISTDSGRWVTVSTNRTWTYGRWGEERAAPCSSPGCPTVTSSASTGEIEADERAKGEPGVLVLRRPSDDELENIYVGTRSKGDCRRASPALTAWRAADRSGARRPASRSPRRTVPRPTPRSASDDGRPWALSGLRGAA